MSVILASVTMWTNYFLSMILNIDNHAVVKIISPGIREVPALVRADLKSYEGKL